MKRTEAEKRAAWFDATKFVNPDVGTFGNLGRGFFEKPRALSMDFAVLKHFPFGREAQREVEFRCEFFNFLNTHVLADPDRTVGGLNLGKIIGQYGSPRYIQLGLKFMF